MTLRLDLPTGAALRLARPAGARVRLTNIFNPADHDAFAYLAAVEQADGQALEQGVRNAITNFVIGCKNDGIWPAIKASCILAGARTLNGALVPLVGTAPTNNNFQGPDYDRKTGLKGNALDKTLDSNRASNADPQDKQHLAVFVSGSPSSYALIGEGTILTGATHVFPGSSNIVTRSRNGVPNTTSVTPVGGLIGISRSSAGSYLLRMGLSNYSISSTSQAPTGSNSFVFSRGGGNSPTDARLAFYSIGESLNLALLDARVTDLINAIGAAIP